jgi:hypothetical protein
LSVKEVEEAADYLLTLFRTRALKDDPHGFGQLILRRDISDAVREIDGIFNRITDVESLSKVLV